jgi:hypothetical protein
MNLASTARLPTLDIGPRIIVKVSQEGRDPLAVKADES